MAKKNRKTKRGRVKEKETQDEEADKAKKSRKTTKRRRVIEEETQDEEVDKVKKTRKTTKRGRVKEDETQAKEPKIEEKKEKVKPEEPTDDFLRSHIRRLIPLVNLQNTGVKAFTKLLSKECGGTDLKPRMKFIKVTLSEVINELDDSSDESEKKGPKKPRKTGLSIKKEISAELAGFLGKKPSELLARTDVVKGMWGYIKANNLQNPDNKREILLDEKMKKVFGCDTFTMFTMNKYLGAHIHPYKPVDLTTNTTKKKKTGTPGRKRKKKNGENSDDSGDDRKKKRKPKKPGLQPPYKLSKELAEIVGTNILPRPQVVKGIWAHIKKHDLQNPKDKREIICDDKLRKVMGGEDRVTMFNMNRYVTDHLLEKLDRSEYNHDEAEAELLARDEEEE